MSIQIGTIHFDKYEGTIETPKASARPFSTAGTLNTGAHVQPIRPNTFVLRTWYHDDDSNLGANQATLLALIGTTKAIIADGITYATAFSCQFFVTDVRIIEANIIPHASGTRNSLAYSWSPASRVVAEITLLAVPV